MNKKALVFLDFDIVIRAFIHSGTFAELERAYEVTYVFHVEEESDKKGIHIDVDSLGLKRVVKLGTPRRRQGWWYLLHAVSVLRGQRGTPNYATIRKLKYVCTNGERNTRIFEFLGLPGIYQLFRWAYIKWMGRLDVLEALIGREAPDVIIHPSLLTGPFINDLLLSAKRRGIPLIVCMNSWDNPTSKAVCTAFPDWLVVWGEQSRREAITYMGMPEDRIKCFGAAQFQVYRTPPEESRDELCAQFGVPGDKRIILYAGINFSLMETEYLRLLEEAVERGILPGCHILYRPHPWRGRLMEGEADFFSLDWKHITMDPHMVDYYKREIVSPSRKLFMIDYRITNKFLTLADAVVSPKSTILVEALVKRKPVMVFFPEEQEGAPFSVDSVHFKDFIELDTVNACLKHDQFFECCANLARQIGDADVASRLGEHAEFFSVTDGPDYGQRLAALVDESLTAPRT